MPNLLQKAWQFFSGVSRQTDLIQTGNGTAQWSGRSARSFVDEGYSKCSVVFRCVDLIARAASSVPLYIRMPGAPDLSDAHPLARLLARPNPSTDGPSFIYDLLSWRLLSGNAWATAVVGGEGQDDNVTAQPLELWPRWPDQMRVIAVNDDALMPIGYEWRGTCGGVKTWMVDPMTGRANAVHWRGFSGTNRWYGMSPLEAAARSVDQANAIGESNKKLLDNGGQPRGILKVDSKLQDMQKDSLRRQWEDKYGGVDNSGRTPVLDGGLSFQQLALSPKEMDWIESRKWTAQEIASVYGVPLQMVPIEGSQTFANYEQARLALYEDTALPWLDSLVSMLNQWLAPRYGAVQIAYDRDMIGALEPRRKDRWAAAQNADFLTVNEKREATGYGPSKSEGADQIMIGAGMVPLDLVEDTAAESDPTGTDEISGGDMGNLTAADVARGGMNGAQVAGMLAILAAVSAGTLTAEGAVQALLAAFPGIIDETGARRIVAGARPDERQDGSA
jgi:HK97 family phage portal protein